MEHDQADRDGRRPRKSQPGGDVQLSSAAQSAASKRAQVSRACKRCASSKRKCSGTFPCERCVRMGTADTCEEVETKRGGLEGDASVGPPPSARPVHAGPHEGEGELPAATSGSRRKRPADDDTRSESGLSTAMSRARLGSAPRSYHGTHRESLTLMETVPEAREGGGGAAREASETELAANLDLLLRASGEKDAAHSALMDAARAQVRQALRAGRLMPRRVELAPTVFV